LGGNLLEKITDALGRVVDNVWAFLLFVIAGVLALVGGIKHLDSIVHFAETVAMTGAALFHGKTEKEKKD
jgi:hypothetical protein